MLDGRTFAVKDLIDVAGCRTGAGNPTWLAQQAPAVVSAAVVEKTLAAGATLIGKTITDELAFSLEGRNVHYDRPGQSDLPGSSARRFIERIGCRGRGRPDRFCARHRYWRFDPRAREFPRPVRFPSEPRSAIPLDGVVPFAPSYDTVGWFARDAELLADVGAALLPQA